jgi:hypothetical protein
VALSRSRTVAGITLVVALSFVLGSSAAFAPPADAFVSNAMLTVVDGEVHIAHHGEEFFAARVGDVLAAGDTIRTRDQASAEITYFEGSSVRLEPQTELVVERLATRPDGTAIIGITQTIGRTWHVVTNLMSGSSRYELRTPSSTASVRG